MCTELYDPATGFRADSPRELAAKIGPDNLVWHSAYGGVPIAELIDACLCPVDVPKTMAKIGGQSHGYMGESGYFEITLP